MADPNIQLPSLPSAVSANNSDLMLIRQGTEDKKATVQVIKDRILNGRDYTAAEILDLLKTVDGVGSGLDADLLDGQQGAFYQNASNLNAGIIPQARISAVDILALLQGVDGPGSDLNADLLDNQHGSFYQNANNLNAGTVPLARLSANGLLDLIKTVDGPGSNLNADLLDSQHGSFYQNAGNLNAGIIPEGRVNGNYHFANINATRLNIGTVPLERLTNSSTATKGIIEIATQSEVNAGTDNVRAVVPSTLRNNVQYSLADTGYIRFPAWLGGFTIQWGTNTAPANGTSGLFSFPIAFTNVFVASSNKNLAQPTANNGNSAGILVASNSQYRVYHDADGTASVSWIAVGIS